MFALSFVAIAGFFVQIFLSLILCFYVGFCWLIISFVKDVTNDLDVLTHNGADRSGKHISEIFYEIIDLYSNVKQLSEELIALSKEKILKEQAGERISVLCKIV